MRTYSLILALVLITSYARAVYDPAVMVHLALAGRDSSGYANTVSVSWSTTNSTQTSTVKYGTVSGEYASTLTGSQASYWETFHHHVVLDALEPGATYFYRAGDDEAGWSEEFSFASPTHVAPSSTSSADDSFSFAVYGDLGIHLGGPTISRLDKWASRGEIDLVWHGGDVGYADDSFVHKDCVFKFCYESVYDEYMNAVESWTSKIPYMTLPGNHEADCHDPACLADAAKREKLSNFTTFNTRFRMPAPESGATALNMHYSFNYKNVHFISMDSETGYPGATEETRYVLPCGGFWQDQLEWLEQDLIQANKDRGERPWILAQAHRPLYQGSSVNKRYQDAVEGLFKKYKVDVYFSGHVHWYERNYPVYDSQVPSTDPETAYVNPVDTTYVMVGGAGNDEMRKTMLSPIFKDPSPRLIIDNSEAGPWTAVQDKDHIGIGKVTIHDATTMEFEYVISETGKVFDTFTLTRER